MDEMASWILMLFERGHGLSAFDTRFLYDLHKEMVEENIENNPDRREELRRAALEAIQSDDSRRQVQGFSFLLVAGEVQDILVVEPYTSSSDENIQKAAKTCLFELRQMEKRCR